MSTRFWLKPTSVPLSLLEISELSEDEAWMLLAQMRWASTTEQVCPDCGAVDNHYVRRSRRQWRCKGCKFVFSQLRRLPRLVPLFART